MQKIDSRDLVFMNRALKMAEKGRGCVHPNPLVGAVLVKNGKIIGEGAHLRFGGPHAEIAALQTAKKIAVGATLYVTLEPCAHYGKTPPCSEAILKHGVKRVVVGAKDPNPLVRGRGLRDLKKQGVSIATGVLERDCEALNRDYAYWMKKKMPYVVVKVAQSLDGKIATSTGDSQWITGMAARKWAHQLRASVDAVLVGVNTILKDDPLLSVRHVKSKTQPMKIILDSRLRTPKKASIFSKKSSGHVLLVVSQKVPRLKIDSFGGKPEILKMPERNGHLDLKRLFQALAKRGIVRILIEGGGEVIGEAFDKRLVNEIYFFMAPKIVGGRAAVSSVSGEGVKQIERSIGIRHSEILRVGQDFLVRGIV